MKISNPWSKLPKQPPFILPSDREAIETLKKRGRGDFLIIDELLPVPYLGNPEAPIILLNLNPGYSPKDKVLQKSARFVKASRQTLLHQHSKSPFYYLDASIERSQENPGPGTNWWRHKLGPELRELPDKVLQRSFFCVEYFPYRSRNFRRLRPPLESQEYSFELVRRAMRQKALVILMRGKPCWFDAVPKLETYKWLCVLRNPRNPTLTPRNMSHGCYTAMMRRLRY
jgi:hypothetical protein